MSRRRTESFTVYTARGRGSYRSRKKAEAAARWVADETGERPTIVNERSGEIYESVGGVDQSPRLS